MSRQSTSGYPRTAAWVAAALALTVLANIGLLPVFVALALLGVVAVLILSVRGH